MTNIDISERLIVAAGHHRQPRSTATWVPLNDPNNPDQPTNSYAVGSTFQHNFAAAVHNDSVNATFAFWSITDGTNGSTSANTHASVPVGTAPMHVVAWYVPVGGIPGVGSGYFVDAFSDAAGDFVNYDFVTVTSDPSLTHDANVVGEVPTVHAETLQAYDSMPTGEGFEHWIGGSAANEVDSLAAGSSGFAIATYHREDVVIPNVDVNVNEREGWIILYGVVNDAPGAGIHIGGSGGPVPIDPGWGSYLTRVGKAAVVGSLGARMHGAAEIARIALAEVNAAAKDLNAHLGKQAGREVQG